MAASRFRKISTLLAGLAVGSVLLWIVSWSYFAGLDERASKEFGEKAVRLGIRGKPKNFILSNFGSPKRTYLSDGKEILVYVPGPILARWNSECKVGVDRQTGLVTGWTINSD